MPLGFSPTLFLDSVCARRALAFAALPLLADRDILLAAVAQNAEALQFASEGSHGVYTRSINHYLTVFAISMRSTFLG
eukprot:689887-Amphidinium_carterae.1